ncbi:MAG: membrane integrity-associated transporter subunit PqiC [Acidobacteria bacterium]|nr:membrane integrity-associated transporter subunit PqiC [Acidobacteriota bacterium]
MSNPGYRGKLAVGVLLMLAATACGAPRTSFYTLQLASPVQSASASRGQLGVEAPRASHLLRQDRIVYFTQQNQLNFYQYHRWAEPPVFMVQSLLIRQLQGARLFDHVMPYRAQKGLDYLLRGRLLALEEVDGSAAGITARFGLELELVRQKDAEVVWTGRASRERPVSEKTMEAVVEAMSGCVEESLEELTRSMGAALSELEAVEGASR